MVLFLNASLLLYWISKLSFISDDRRDWLHTGCMRPSSPVLHAPPLWQRARKLCAYIARGTRAKRPRVQPVCQLWHLMVFSTSTPANRYCRKSDSKLNITSTGHWERKSSISSFYLDFFPLLKKYRPPWTTTWQVTQLSQEKKTNWKETCSAFTVKRLYRRDDCFPILDTFCFPLST